MRIVVLYGSERFLIEERTRMFAEMLQERFGGVEQFTFDGGIVEPAAVLDELRSYGLMQRHKLVILDNADQFLAGGRNAVEEDEHGGSGGAGGTASSAEPKSTRRPIMERYAENPVDDATLLLRAETWRKGNLDKLILKRGTIVQCEPPPADQAARWCVNRCARRYDATLDRDAAELMVLRLGPELQRLDSELLKLASMIGQGGTITRQLVADNIAPSREEKAWEIQAAVATGQPAVMLCKLHDLVDVSRQDAVPLSWAVIDLLRKEHAASHLLRRGLNPFAVQKMVRLFGPGTEGAMTTARRVEPPRLAQLLREAVQSDQHSKSGVGDPVRNLEVLMVKIADVTTGQ